MSLDKTILDFRSDTVTKPTLAMRQAMANAEVGDDVIQEDPTVNLLEEKIAKLFGREASLFVPSGTMANLIGIAVHCDRGSEVILERRTHSFAYEVGGGPALLGVGFKVINSASGIISIQEVESAIRPVDIHQPISRLVILENTVNIAGGKVVSLEHIKNMRALTQKHNMRLHIDGARIWNASIASGVLLSDYAAQVDTMSCCLSKGLGCPVGSLVIGDTETINRARYIRKMLGGGMRQVGVLAACGLYAIEHNIERLAEDHLAAKELANGLQNILDGRHRVDNPETNIVLVHTDSKSTTESTHKDWTEKGILCFALGDRLIRLVTHQDLPKDAAKEVIRRIGK